MDETCHQGMNSRHIPSYEDSTGANATPLSLAHHRQDCAFPWTNSLAFLRSSLVRRGLDEGNAARASSNASAQVASAYIRLAAVAAARKIGMKREGLFADVSTRHLDAPPETAQRKPT
jgi:hypothetical protein